MYIQLSVSKAKKIKDMESDVITRVSHLSSLSLFIKWEHGRD